MKTIKAQKSHPLKRLFRQSALTSIAKSLVRAPMLSAAAGDDLLYGLPGVFVMRISYRDSYVRLIKEANALRIMKDSEKSDVLLSAEILDEAALGDLSFHTVTWQKAYAEGRVRFAGKAKYAAVIVRVAKAGDQAELSQKKYQNLYGE